jgi:hypothetical protein
VIARGGRRYDEYTLALERVEAVDAARRADEAEEREREPALH